MISKSTVVKDTSLGCLEYGQRVFSCDFQKFPHVQLIVDCDSSSVIYLVAESSWKNYLTSLLQKLPLLKQGLFHKSQK